MSRLRALSALVLLLGAGCVGGEVSTTTTLPLPVPEASLAEEYVELVAFEARWKCDVQRYSFDDLAAIEADLSERLTESGISAEEYESFKSELDSDRDLRLHARWAYEDVCKDFEG